MKNKNTAAQFATDAGGSSYANRKEYDKGFADGLAYADDFKSPSTHSSSEMEFPDPKKVEEFYKDRPGGYKW